MAAFTIFYIADSARHICKKSQKDLKLLQKMLAVMLQLIN